MDDKRRSKGSVLCGVNSRGQSFPHVLIQRKDIPVQLPTIQPGICPIGLHCYLKAICCPAETYLGMQLIVYTDDIFVPAEFKDLARDHVIRRLGVPVIDLGFVIGKTKCFGTFIVNRVLRLLSEFSSVRAESSSREDKEDQGRDTATSGRQPGCGQEAVPVSGQTAGSNQDSTSGPLVLPQVTTGTTLEQLDQDYSA